MIQTAALVLLALLGAPLFAIIGASALWGFHSEEIDLHGLSAEDARDALARFLIESVERRHRCVRVIHGKGLRSGPGGPVIKRRIGRWLKRRDEVLAYASARPVDGGTGAVYVLLKISS